MKSTGIKCIITLYHPMYINNYFVYELYFQNINAAHSSCSPVRFHFAFPDANSDITVDEYDNEIYFHFEIFIAQIFVEKKLESNE